MANLLLYPPFPFQRLANLSKSRRLQPLVAALHHKLLLVHLCYILLWCMAFLSVLPLHLLAQWMTTMSLHLLRQLMTTLSLRLLQWMTTLSLHILHVQTSSPQLCLLQWIALTTLLPHPCVMDSRSSTPSPPMNCHHITPSLPVDGFSEYCPNPSPPAIYCFPDTVNPHP